MRRAFIWLFIALAAPLALAGCNKAPTEPAPGATAGKGPTAAKRGLTADGHMQIDAADRCPVCGMAPHTSPKFASAISAKDGTTWYFCGTGCMLRGHLHPEVYLGRPPADLDRHVVHEYFGGEHIDATTAYWVTGSDVMGPMGPPPVPLASAADAATFKQRHGGKHTFKMADLTDATFETFTGKPALRAKGRKRAPGRDHAH